MAPTLRVATVAFSLATATMLIAPTPSATAAPLPMAQCTTTTPLTLLNFNDFHGRLAKSSPDTAQFVGTIEELRAAAGESNSLLLSAGDSVGATLFASFAANDEPTLDLLNAMDVDASAAGNHEFDQGWADLRDRIVPGVDFPYLAANVFVTGESTSALPAYTIIEKAGLRVGIVGAVTGDLPSLVSPAGISSLTVTDPVDAVNATVDALTDSIEANGEADVIVVEYHEGATAGDPNTLESQLAASAVFNDIVSNTHPRAQVIFNAHTHQKYAWTAPNGAGTRPIVQAGSYASNIGKVVLNLDPTTGETCSFTASVAGMSTTSVTTLLATYPRAAAAKQIVDQAIADSNVIGQQVVGVAAAPITRAYTVGTDGKKTDVRGRESTISNLVAQMIKDTLGADDPNFIGLQNPGGNREDFDAGNILYAEAAAILPFANTLMTTKLTGAQVKTVLEQQWQRTKDGVDIGGSRPYLHLGSSSNLSWTYDGSRPRDSRITSIRVNGKPIDPSATYTVGGTSFLIAGGDNFWELAKGKDATDSGRADLEAWVEWIQSHGTTPIAPSYAKHGVSVHPTPTLILGDVGTTFSVGVPQTDGIALDTLDLHSNGVVNTTLIATLVDYKPAVKAKVKVKDGVVIGTATVVDGKVTAITVKPPKGAPKGTGTLVLTAPDSGTVIKLKVSIKQPPK